MEARSPHTPSRYAGAPPSTPSQDARVQLKEQVLNLSLRNTSLMTEVAMLKLTVRELRAALAVAPEAGAAPAPAAALVSADARRAAATASRVATDALRAADASAAFANGAVVMLNALARAGKVCAEGIYDAATEQPPSASASDSALDAAVRTNALHPSAAHSLKRGAASAAAGASAKRVRTEASAHTAAAPTAAAAPREDLYVQLTGFALNDHAATEAKRVAETTISALAGAHHFSWDYGARGKRRMPTHLVAPPGAVTLKTVAAALVGGVWMVTPEWIAASAQAERWVDEAPYGVRSVAALAQQRIVLTAKLAEALANRRSRNRRKVNPSKSPAVLKVDPTVLKKMVAFGQGELFDCRDGGEGDVLQLSGGEDVIVVALDENECGAVRDAVASPATRVVTYTGFIEIATATDGGGSGGRRGGAACST